MFRGMTKYDYVRRTVTCTWKSIQGITFARITCDFTQGTNQNSSCSLYLHRRFYNLPHT